ncbi:unnamed protein product (macronuclear) [Paramecium tetraurelia]|uniref:Uncharacterized protein n=1 Tax=Paramecium tetraurelia TaxID=5888 RepID=A0C8Z8_PARTE|nr:uncharacterized protein GSPATT00006571001 [Paramecium tetraurelia]CAK67265.1 unnamed protein product [Paramecium tetraurelia]|eukprot:XP_001434662.1 hypothetical protein (macronuclear) [Paramecium tetraurelia strain d4-2]
MHQISTKEGKYLYGLYVLCQGNIISSSQKGYLKDLLIQKDEQILEIVNEFNKYECISELQTKLLEILVGKAQLITIEICQANLKVQLVILQFINNGMINWDYQGVTDRRIIIFGCLISWGSRKAK